MKRILNAFFCAAVLTSLGLAPGALRAAGPPVPAESILVIYTDADLSGYSVTLKNAFVAALSAVVPAPTITQLNITTGHVGIYNDLHALAGAPTDLSQWCQVWDLRFRSDKDNIAYTGPNQEDVITFAGANNDTLLFTNYLNMNGHLFMQGEHHDFYIRDQNLFAFINAVATVPVSPLQGAGGFNYADYNAMNTGNITGFPAVPAAFNTSWNNIAGLNIAAAFPGGLEVNYAGSGQPIGANFPGAYFSAGGTCNTAYVWMPAALTTNGRLVVNWETNAFVAPQANAVSNGWIQNVYELLSGCYRYSLTKAFGSPLLCVGDSSYFTLCYTNSGSTPLSNVQLWDTIPSCLTYVSDNLGGPGPTINGPVYDWNIPSIGAGASACFTVNFTVNGFACP